MIDLIIVISMFIVSGFCSWSLWMLAELEFDRQKYEKGLRGFALYDNSFAIRGSKSKT